MFTRSRRAAEATPPAPAPVSTPRRGRFVTVTTVEAVPDHATIGLVHNLQASIGAGLQGQGTAIGYDRGDPGLSLTAPVRARPGAVATAMAAVYAYHNTPAPDEISGSLATNPKLDPYNALLWSRFAR